jgi:predicted alpha/beta hydrolase
VQRWLVALRLFAVLPAVARTFGYVPGPLGLGEDMPSGVLLEWARWCREPGYLYGDHPQIKQAIAAYRGPVLALSVTDDDFAPHANVEWLLDRHERARVEHLRFAPRDVGSRTFGHFGFFRHKVGGPLWPSIVAFLDEQRGVARPGDARRGASRPGPAEPEPLLTNEELLLQLFSDDRFGPC